MKIQISLKWMLIVLGTFGTVIGLLGRLWLRNPEMCLLILRFSIMVGYVGSVAVIYLRRNLVQKSQALQWLLPALSVGWLLLLLSGCLKSDTSRALPTKFLVQKKLFVHRDGRLGSDPAVWQELERRFFDDRLSKSDAQLIFTEYERALKKQMNPPEFQSAPSSQLLRRMASRGMVSDEQLVSLGEAFYGKPTSPSLRLRTTEDSIHISTDNYGRYFGKSHPTTLIWYATSVKVDGNRIGFENGSRGHAATINEGLEAGQREIRVELDCALVIMTPLVTVRGHSWLSLTRSRSGPINY